MIPPFFLFLAILTVTESTQPLSQNGHHSQCLHINGSHCAQRDGKGCYYLSRVESEGTVEAAGCIHHESSSKIAECAEQMGNEKKCTDYGPDRICCCSGDLCSSPWTVHTKEETLLSFSHLYHLTLALITASLVWWSPVSFLNLSKNFFRKAQFISISKTFYGVFFGVQGVKVLVSLLTLAFFFWPFQWRCKKLDDEFSFRPNSSIVLFLLPPSLPSAFVPFHHFAYAVYACYSMRVMCSTGRCVYRSWQLVLAQLLPLTAASTSTAYNLRLTKEILSRGEHCGPSHALPMIALYLSMCSILLEVLSSILFLGFHFIARKKTGDDQSLVLSIRPETPDESTLAETAQPNTPIDVDTLLIQPNPFVLSSYHDEVLSITNRHTQEWVALRVVISVPFLYVINPQRLLIPPLKTSTVEIRAAQSMEGKSDEHSLLVEWFVSGSSSPDRDVSTFWTRPHYRPRSQWKHVVIPIFHEERLPSRVIRGEKATGGVVVKAAK